MFQEQKKVYTMEDNVKSISFAVKDMVKELKQLNEILAELIRSLPSSQ